MHESSTIAMHVDVVQTGFIDFLQDLNVSNDPIVPVLTVSQTVASLSKKPY